MTSRPRPISRRHFVAASATAVAAPWLIRPARAASVNEKLNIAVIGVGGRGWANLQAVRGETIVALCDVDANNLERAATELPGAGRYRDYRRMLEERNDIDAVVVSTTDHAHAPASCMAMRLGKHVYCEKPLAHTVEEVRAMRTLAKQSRVTTQMGTQIHAGGNYRRVVELIRAGAIGPVREVHVWCGKSWSNGRYSAPSSPPPHLEWDLWLGSAAERPYCTGLHPASWRRFWDFGMGTLGDMGCHYIDLAHWALDLEAPTAIHTLGPARHPDGTPESIIVHLSYPARGEQPPVRVTWYDGNNRPSIRSALRRADGSRIDWNNGQLFVGDDGMLLSDYGRHVLLPEERFAGFTPPAPTIPDSIGHHAEWIQACKDGSTTTCNFDYSGALTEAVLLGNVAFRAGEPIEWDAAAMKVTNLPAANRYVATERRAGWEL
jgi:predicted dehydrogenase